MVGIIQKPVDWCKRHKKEITETAAMALLMTSGYMIGDAFATMKISLGLEKFHRAGFIKFFNPETGAEVTEEVANDLIQRYFKK